MYRCRWVAVVAIVAGLILTQNRPRENLDHELLSAMKAYRVDPDEMQHTSNQQVTLALFKQYLLQKFQRDYPDALYNQQVKALASKRVTVITVLNHKMALLNLVTESCLVKSSSHKSILTERLADYCVSSDNQMYLRSLKRVDFDIKIINRISELSNEHREELKVRLSESLKELAVENFLQQQKAKSS